jgi:hypothetical protein
VQAKRKFSNGTVLPGIKLANPYLAQDILDSAFRSLQMATDLLLLTERTAGKEDALKFTIGTVQVGRA